jgi:phage/plasmid-like protein (TIGR03299 family)
MSHELTIRADGRAEMAYVGETPWHGLGQALQKGASIEEWQVAAGMDWRIQRAIVRYATSLLATRPDEFATMDDRHVLMRSDSKAALGIVSDNYRIVQPKAVLEFFRDLTESAGFTLETAGTLFGGKRFWALASTGLSSSIGDVEDRVKGFLLLSTSSDGTLATEGRYTNVRVVCNNTLQMAREKGAKVRITHKTEFDAAAVKKELGVETAGEAFESAMSDLRKLAEKPVSAPVAMMQTARLFDPNALDLGKKELIKLLDSKPVARINELALTGKGLIGKEITEPGTQWTWLNAVTQYFDHEARARSKDNRLNSAWFGKGSDLKEKAFELAMEADGSVTQVAVTQTATTDGVSFADLLTKKVRVGLRTE